MNKITIIIFLLAKPITKTLSNSILTSNKGNNKPILNWGVIS